ncbi:uncharacterized protein [Branchiostoma lanceolatum]|uniref:uncharacterized protein n=1 Tax=Branchiostoma lanceolatum TaxID=7740 RepID=UPI00345196C6
MAKKSGMDKHCEKQLFPRNSMEVEVLKSLGDLHLQKGKLGKDSAEFDKAAALYAAALLRCTDPEMGQTLEHRIGYMEKLSRQLLQGYTPHFRWLSPDYWGTADSNVLRVAEICAKLDKRVGKPWNSVEQTYTETLVTAIRKSDLFLELAVLKSLGDLYLEKGKKTSDVSQFSKAAAMYNKALTRCGDPGTKPTLEHRIRYMERIREELEKKPTIKKQRKRRPCMESQSRNTTKTDIIQDQHLDITRQYNDSLKEGESSLARADLDSAEQHFAAALKTVHVKDPTAQQYQREVEPLCKVGDVYSKRGQQTGDGGDFVKAAALYNAAIARSKNKALNGNIAKTIREVDMSFLICVLNIHHNVSQDNTEKHKKKLKEMRDQIKLEMETIDQQLNPYVHDEDDPCVREIEAKRAQAVRQLFENIAQQRKEFISLLVEECIGLMGPPPCKYALIGLGSQATGLVTPYSDLEFAILVEEESEEFLVYFRNLTHYLHLKVVNLGETILPALGIKSLNEFYSENPLDDWYYDSVTPRGFAFDGSMPKASKTPLGRQGTLNEPTSELICTPENMVSKLQNDATFYLKEGYHLATILRNPCLIAGDQDLMGTYKAITANILQADGGKMAEQLAQETMKEDIKTYCNSNMQAVTAKLIDVKKEIYRFPSVAVDYIALSSHVYIMPTTVWKTIEDMENQEVISPNIAHDLTVLTSISAELRLRTYIANGGQKENLSALASMETTLHGKDSSPHRSAIIAPVFHLPNDQQLFRYYYTVVPLKSVLKEWSTKESLLNLTFDFYDNSPRVKGVMYAELCKYEQAISCYQEAQKKADDTEIEKLLLLIDIAIAYQGTGDHRNGINYNEQALQMCRGIYGQSTAHPKLAIVLNNLGIAWHKLGNQRKAISYYEQALQMERGIYGQTTPHHDIASSLTNLGEAWHDLGDHRTAITYHEQALQMDKSIYGKNTAHPVTATTLNNLGTSWRDLGYYKKATSFHEQALKMYTISYGQSTAHPAIAISLNNLGSVWSDLGDCRKAISYYEQSLQIFRCIYGQCTAHPEIATTLNNLGSAWRDLDDYRKAISYHEQALEMRKRIYGENTTHLAIAQSLDNLGIVWNLLGEHRKAISQQEQALQIYRTFYGKSTAHPDIATSLDRLGGLCLNLGDYRKAVSHSEQALQMFRSIHGKSTAHPDIVRTLHNKGKALQHQGDYREATSYNEQALQMCRLIYGQSTPHIDIAATLHNLGSAWSGLGDDRKAICYYEQALQMYRSIHGKSTAHSDIAFTLNKLGETWGNLGDYRKAISYHELVLQMRRSIYGQNTAHPEIATSLNNLGVAWYNLGDYRKAITYQGQALEMRRSIYGQSTAHPAIALSLNNIGSTWSDLGNNRKAISYHEQALQMNWSIYGQSTPHPHISNSLNNLGTAWFDLGDYRKAISYYEQALQMRWNIHGQSTPHPNIAILLNNLGTACDNLGYYRKAISHHEQALQMYRSIYGMNSAHPYIAALLTNLGEAWCNLGDYKAAITYYEQALQMYRMIHGQSTAHPHIAKSLTGLGLTLCYLGDHSRALSLCQEALVMARQVYPQDKSHPSIKAIERNIAWIISSLK